MRRIIVFFVAILLILAMTVGVSAATSASRLAIYATVATDGSCQVTATLTLRLEQNEGVAFPIPREAANVTINGTRARTYNSGDVKFVEISGVLGGVTGTVSVTLNYTLYNLVGTNAIGGLELQLPLLSGFAYPIEEMEFSVTLPGMVQVLPSFSSGYHQAGIEQYLSCSKNGAALTGKSLQAMKDHETLVMTLPVEETLFPSLNKPLESSTGDDIAMGICAVLALLYYLAFIRISIPHRQKTASPPDGYSAGQLASILTLQGSDLSLMVLSWAQLGYLRIRKDARGRVSLYRQMDMGNERSPYEQRCFQALFARRDLVDTAGLQYAMLGRSLARSRADAGRMLSGRVGNPLIFRVFAALMGLFSGVGVGIVLGHGSALQGFWIAVFAILGAFCAWQIQSWASGLFLRSKGGMVKALLLAAFWLLLSHLAGELTAGVLTVLGQLIAGLLLSFGGRRSDSGLQAMELVLGLRRYLREFTPEQARSASHADPDYFFSLLPWALALGMDKRFAKCFGKQRMQQCPYLTDDQAQNLTAEQWSRQMRTVLSAMELRRRQMPLERLQKVLQSLRR